MTGSPDTAGPPKLLREAFAGLVVGFGKFVRAIALVTLVFAGSLAGGEAAGTTVFLLAGIAGVAVLSGIAMLGPAASARPGRSGWRATAKPRWNRPKMPGSPAWTRVT